MEQDKTDFLEDYILRVIKILEKMGVKMETIFREGDLVRLGIFGEFKLEKACGSAVHPMVFPLFIDLGFGKLWFDRYGRFSQNNKKILQMVAPAKVYKTYERVRYVSSECLKRLIEDKQDNNARRIESMFSGCTPHKITVTFEAEVKE